MTKSRSAVRDLIEKGADAITKATAFSEWFSTEAPKGEGLIAINNSFIYRDLVETSKNANYLCVSLQEGKILTQPLLVAKPRSFNPDFKFFKSTSKTKPETESLETALKSELEGLGQLLFVLIGQIEDVPWEVSIDHRYAGILKFDPSTKQTGTIASFGDGERCVLVNELLDPEAAWSEIQLAVQDELGDEVEGFQAAFAAAFDNLQQEARSRLHLPSVDSPNSQSSFLGRVRESVSKQRRLYEDALGEALRSKSADDHHLNEVLRIAYNFAEDAVKVLTLLVSVCDLKGVILWCTLHRHFELAEAFRALPWARIKGKASLGQYKKVVNGARNRAFHNLLGFDRTLVSDLTGVTIKARSLTLLPAYERRKSYTSFDYVDRELVEVLSELTLAPETAVSMEFWNRNADVMAKFEGLLEATEDALWTLNAART